MAIWPYNCRFAAMIQDNLLLVLSLLFVISILTMISGKLKIAYPIFLVIGGLLISLIPGIPRIFASPRPGVPYFSTTAIICRSLEHLLERFLAPSTPHQ